MSRFRSSTGNLSHLDDEPNRWDREKFERLSRRPQYEDDYRFAERDRFGPRGGVRDVAVSEKIDSRGPRGRFEERDRYFEEERFGPPSRRRSEFLEEPTPSEIASRALAPYRRRSIVERDIDPVPTRRPRPQLIRRQSSLDTFDRRPMPRYGDEYRIPPEIPIPLPIRRPQSPPRRYREEGFEEVRYKDLPEYDEYRDIRVRRERHGRRSRSRAATSVRSSSSSSSSFEEVPAPPKIGKRGKTRMPKRLAHKKAVVELGYPFEEEEDFIIIQRALAKEHIDEIIEKSKIYKEEKVIYKYESETVKEEAKPVALPPPPPPPVAQPLPPPPPPPAPAPAPPAETVVKTTTTVIENPPPASVRAPSPARTHNTHHTHQTHHTHHTHPREEYVEERIVEESNHIGGPLTMVLPPERHHHHTHSRDLVVGGRHDTDIDIRREIKALEAERRALKLEREADERRYQAALIRDSRESDFEFVERVERVDRDRPRDVIRVEKDRKGRLALVRSAH